MKPIGTKEDDMPDLDEENWKREERQKWILNTPPKDINKTLFDKLGFATMSSKDALNEN